MNPYSRAAQDVKEERLVTKRSGLKYVDVRIGGGAPVQPGQLLILDYRSNHAALILIVASGSCCPPKLRPRSENDWKGFITCRATANGQAFEDTKERGKPIVFTFGSRPFTGGICRGAEEALGSMRAGGCMLQEGVERNSVKLVHMGAPLCAAHMMCRCAPYKVPPARD